LDVALQLYPTRELRDQVKKEAPYAARMLAAMEAAHRVARINIERAKAKQQLDYDKGRREVIYDMGDKVWLFIYKMKPGCSRKFAERWSGPWRVIQRTGPMNYKISSTRGKELEQHVNVRRLKPYVTLERKPEAEPALPDEDRIDGNDPALADYVAGPAIEPPIGRPVPILQPAEGEDDGRVEPAVVPRLDEAKAPALAEHEERKEQVDPAIVPKLDEAKAPALAVQREPEPAPMEAPPAGIQQEDAKLAEGEEPALAGDLEGARKKPVKAGNKSHKKKNQWEEKQPEVEEKLEEGVDEPVRADEEGFRPWRIACDGTRSTGRGSTKKTMQGYLFRELPPSNKEKWIMVDAIPAGWQPLIDAFEQQKRLQEEDIAVRPRTSGRKGRGINLHGRDMKDAAQYFVYD
jgi:hypothetical protein